MINDDYDYYPNAMMIDDYIKIIQLAFGLSCAPRLHGALGSCSQLQRLALEGLRLHTRSVSGKSQVSIWHATASATPALRPWPGSPRDPRDPRVAAQIWQQQWQMWQQIFEANILLQSPRVLQCLGQKFGWDLGILMIIRHHPSATSTQIS